MITVNFIGGAKKWFNLAHLSIDKQDLSIKQLLKHLVEIKPKDTIDLVDSNLLIAVNGIDSRDRYVARILKERNGQDSRLE